MLNVPGWVGPFRHHVAFERWLEEGLRGLPSATKLRALGYFDTHFKDLVSPRGLWATEMLTWGCPRNPQCP